MPIQGGGIVDDTIGSNRVGSLDTPKLHSESRTDPWWKSYLAKPTRIRFNTDDTPIRAIGRLLIINANNQTTDVMYYLMRGGTTCDYRVQIRATDHS